ncbi:uncharacterized protein LOC124363508 [Homalodisca vitripennis]|uniref:uncharacterized protein LOC124363508 n=1 Tax=Homalodisca vitripennis TaxID=197043 RepID=UPI001EE9B93E|nr:uncharacterized protein LOC124363508 [Homalodisca vitripennis]
MWHFDYCTNHDLVLNKEKMKTKELIFRTKKNEAAATYLTNYLLLSSDVVESDEKLKEELEEVNVVYAATCEKVERLQAEYDRLKKDADEKTTHDKIVQRKKIDLENEYAVLSRSKISSHDEQLKETTKMRYKALRNITQVRFTFEESDNNRLEGLAFNLVNNKTKYFTISNLSKLKPDQISEHIMVAMEAVSGTNYADIALE